MITTKRPDDDMIEVAIVSMEEALTADGEALPSNSALPREPMVLPGTTPAGQTAAISASAEAEAATPVTLDPPLPGA